MGILASPDAGKLLPDDFGHWLAGFIDGEGCFAIEEAHKRDAITYRPTFTLGVRADDRAVMEDIVRRTGLGVLYFKPGRPPLRPNPQLDWRVSSRRDSAGVVALLRKYPLRTKKRCDFEIWARAVSRHALKTKRGRLGRNDWSDLAELRVELWHARRAGLVSEKFLTAPTVTGAPARNRDAPAPAPRQTGQEPVRPGHTMEGR